MNPPPRDLREIRHLVWDWNGTLLDDVAHCVDVLNQLREGTAVEPLTTAFYREHFGFPVIRFYEKLGFAIQPAAFAVLSERFISTYYASVERTSLHPEAQHFARTWKARGRRQAVLSASRQDHLFEAVDHFGLRSFFDAFGGIDDIYAGGKLSRGEHLLRELGWCRSETLLIGDTDHDAEVARALGTDCLLLARGHQSRRRLVATGARVADTLAEATARWGLGAED